MDLMILLNESAVEMTIVGINNDNTHSWGEPIEDDRKLDSIQLTQ